MDSDGPKEPRIRWGLGQFYAGFPAHWPGKHWGCLLLCVFGVCPTAMCELITIPFGMWAQLGPRTHLLGVGRGYCTGGDNFGG